MTLTEIIDCQLVSNRCVGLDFYAQTFDIISVGLDYILGKSEFRDSGGWYSPDNRGSFINGNAVACFYEIVGGSETGRS